MSGNPVWITQITPEPAAKGPLSGLRFAVKDNIDIAGIPTTAGCPAFAYKAERSASVVERLLGAGAVAIGKTNLDQFATGLVGTRSPFGACHSIFDERFISGGSSSGSAVAVAGGLVDFALGTDTAGSGRVPAAFNNIVGLKPTRGLISTRGVVPACRSLDCVSIFAKSVALARSVLDAAEGFDAEDPFSRHALPRPNPGAPFRFGISRERLEFFGDRDAESLYGQAVARCLDLGGRAVEIELAPFLDAAKLLYQGPWVAERLAALRAFGFDRPEAMDPIVREIIYGAEAFSAVEAFQAQYRLALLIRAAETIWNAIDVLLLPTTGTIYRIEDVRADPIRLNSNLGLYTNFVNLMDLCAVAVPAGFRRDGLPLGISFIAQAFQDRNLLNLAERFMDFDLRKIELAVVGAHLSGQALNWQLTSRGARLIRTCRTAPGYSLYALAGQTPPKPGLVFDGTGRGGIEVEIWELTPHAFGTFVSQIPPPLGIGTLRLEGDATVKGFLCEGHALKGALDITDYGGWRHWLARE